MVFRQLATDARAPVTNSEHCGSDWLLHKLFTSMFWTVAILPSVLVITSVYGGVPTHILKSVGFLVVQPGFFAASSDANFNLVEVYIIEFLKVCRLLWYNI